MVPLSPSATMIVAISPDPDQTRDLLSWAVSVLARPNHHIVALHVLDGKSASKGAMTKKYQSKIRRSKAYVISMLGEFAKACHFKEIYLEARVVFSSNVGKGLVQEAKSLSADFLLLGGSRSRPEQYPYRTLRYCFENAPRGCAVVSIGGSFTRRSSFLDSKQYESSGILDSKQLTSVIEHNDSESECRSMWEDSSSFGDSALEFSRPSERVVVGSNRRKQISPFRFVYSLLASLRRTRRRNGDDSGEETGRTPVRCFSHEEILNATKHFHQDNMIGQGGYSEVYRGDLCNGEAIAVKRLSEDNKDETKEKEFLMELGVISHVSHPNTARLLGYCIQNGLYLIFNLSLNGNLASALHGGTGKSRESLPWETRYKVAVGVGRGLHYLHKCCKHRIIHRDIKASNILLGKDYEPQITDFGLAKWLPNKWTHHAVIPVEGTFGYLAPEYFMHGFVDEKIDVFAFGVLLLEIVTGRRPVDASKQSLLLWAMPLMEMGNIAELADPAMAGKYDIDQLRKVVFTASHCVRQSSVWRPTMTEVLELLVHEHDSEEESGSWRIPKFASDEMDDYSMVFGYDVPSDISSLEYLSTDDI